jgi:hypothetical protein
MKTMRAILAGCLFFGLIDARAELLLTLTPPARNATPGIEMVFSGALTNTSETNRLFLNDIQANLTSGASNFISFNANTFFANVPGLLLPGEVYTGAVFHVLLSNTAPGGDYGGSITLRGGTDIFATNDLASAAFLISSTTVSIVASDATASEWGPDPGAFTVSRMSSTNFDLTVLYAISGSATNGVTYNLISSSVLIPAGEISATITLTPISDDLAQSKRTATLTLQPNVAYGLGSNVAATVSIHDTPFDVWRLQKFGANANSPAAAPNADWDSDGIQNLLEYALNLEPTVRDVRVLPAPQIIDDHLTWSYVPNPNAVDVMVVVEASTNLTDWSAANVEVVAVSNPDPPHRITVRYRHAVSVTAQAFLRLRAIRI